MNINLHIERLILDGVPLSYAERPLLQAALEAELSRLLASGGLGDAPQSSGALYRVQAPGIQLTNNGSPTQMGKQIAGSVYKGIGK